MAARIFGSVSIHSSLGNNVFANSKLLLQGSTINVAFILTMNYTQQKTEGTRMKTLFKKNMYGGAAILVIAVLCSGLTGCAVNNQPPASQAANAELYRAAVLDTMVIEDDEIFPLVPITKDSDMCSWDEQGRVLMLTYHRYPGSYIAGEEYILQYGAVWTFTDREIIKWYKENKNGVTDWTLRFKQLIGLPEDKEYTHFSAFWANPDDIIRPGYAWKLSDTTGAPAFPEKPGEEYKVWFDGNIIWSYFDSAYPWTRLGYTYDWAAGIGDYGLSEFLVRKDAVTHVEFTMTVDEFVAWCQILSM